MSALEKVKQARDAYKGAVTEAGKAAVVEMLGKLFAAHPTVNAIRWTQYTPYFNDGEACVFRVGEVSVRLDGQTQRHDGDDGEFDDYPDDKSINKSMRALESSFSEFEDVLIDAFGDHQRVTVERDGKVESEDYEHD